MIVFLNGQFLPEAQAVVPVNDRGFMLRRRAVRDDARRERQAVSLGAASGTHDARRGFPENQTAVHAEGIGKIRRQLIEQNKMPEAILRVTLTRGPGERGYTPNGGRQTDGRR